MEPAQKLLYTRAEAAEMLSISVGTLDVAIGRGMLRARRQGRHVLLERRELERFARTDHPRIWPESGPDGKTTRRISPAGHEMRPAANDSRGAAEGGETTSGGVEQFGSAGETKRGEA